MAVSTTGPSVVKRTQILAVVMAIYVAVLISLGVATYYIRNAPASTPIRDADKY